MDDNAIADAARLGEAGFYILGKSVGITTMYLLQPQGRPRAAQWPRLRLGEGASPLATLTPGVFGREE